LLHGRGIAAIRGGLLEESKEGNHMRTTKTTQPDPVSTGGAGEREMLLLGNDMKTRLMAMRVLGALYPALELRSIAEFVDAVSAENGTQLCGAESERAKRLSPDIKARVIAIRILSALYPAVRGHAMEGFVDAISAKHHERQTAELEKQL
jgi:hypothetical protein